MLPLKTHKMVHPPSDLMAILKETGSSLGYIMTHHDHTQDVHHRCPVALTRARMALRSFAAAASSLPDSEAIGIRSKQIENIPKDPQRWSKELQGFCQVELDPAVHVKFLLRAQL